jgi:hypothetical protein
MAQREISNSEDILDVRDIMARVEDLESQKEDESLDDDGAQELAHLVALLDEIKGYGGEEQWRGDWYPNPLIRCDYFPEYVKDLVDDVGDWPRNGVPEYLVIDWEATAHNLKADYSEADFDGVSYYYR